MSRPEIPFLQQRFSFFCRAETVENILKIQLDMPGPDCLKVASTDLQLFKTLSLFNRQIFRVLKPYITGLAQFRVIFSFFTANLSQSVVYYFDYVKLIKRQLGFREILTYTLNKGRGHVTAHLLYIFDRAAMRFKESLKYQGFSVILSILFFGLFYVWRRR